jgi:hypothetical protein
MADENKKGPLREIDVNFNIYDSGWEKFGNHRKYVASNVDRLVNGDIVQERVENRVMVGFFGHNSNKALEPEENAENPASHVTTKLQFLPKSGDVIHTQAINRNTTGRAVLSLHDSQVGNFSWRGKGAQSFMGTQFTPEAERHFRFDYVYVPGMVNQSKKDVIIKESASEYEDVIQKFTEHGLDIKEAVDMAANWQAAGIYMADYEQSLHESAIYAGIMEEQVTSLLNFQQEREKIIKEALDASPYQFTDAALKVLLGLSQDGEGKGPLSQDEVLAFIQEVMAYASVDLTKYPGDGKRIVLPKRPELLNERGTITDKTRSAIGLYI